VIASYFTDLTEQKEIERLARQHAEADAKAREAEERAQLIFESAPFACTMFDKDLNSIDCNQETVRMFGVPDKEFFLTRAYELFPEYQPSGATTAEDAAKNVGLAIEKGYHQFEQMYKRLDGGSLPAEVTLVRIKHRGEDVFASYMRDLREQKAVAELEKRKAEAEAANRAKSAFLAMMSHEIRTPMNAILGMAEIQLQDECLPPSAKDALNIIYDSGYSLLGIINDLLDLSKIEAGKMELGNSRYETAGLISDTINLNAARIGDKPIEFKLLVDEDLPLELVGDELRIKQILNNLLSNAFKYTDSGEVMLSLSAEAGGDEDARGVLLMIVVTDTGQGMSYEQVQTIFDVYSRFNMDANRNIEGTGLGMSILQRLVEEMGGDISVQSELGIGTEIIVTVKQGYAGPTNLGSDLAGNILDFRMSDAKTKKSQIVRDPMPYGKVLVVDDMETNLYVARGFLLPYGLTIDTALSGYEAIAKTIERGKDYDIIFMDHMMPGMDGMETTKKLREGGYAHPIVALTANAVAGQVEVFMANGFDGFISKPIDTLEMNASLNKFVRDKHPPEVVEAARAAWSEALQAADDAPRADPGLAKIFIRDAEKAIIAVQEFDGGNLQSYITSVHGLKSALANIGEAKLSALAKELEQAGRDCALDFIADKTPGFLAGLREALEGLKAGLAKENGAEATSEDMAYLEKMLLGVKAACADYDAGAARAALKGLKQRQWPGHIAAMLDTISEHLLNSDFEKAEEACGAQLFDAGTS
jgi:PAS domain S-box-containing protein